MITNETINTILNRRSIRKFKNQEIEKEKLDIIMKCGTMAPSAMNHQSSLIVLLKDEEIKKELFRITDLYYPKKSPYFYGAKTIIIVFGDSTCKCPIEDGSLVLENMFLAAKSLGVGSCWINYLRDLFKTKEGQALQEKMNIDKKYFVVGTCILGYPDEEPLAKARKDGYIREI